MACLREHRAGGHQKNRAGDNVTYDDFGSNGVLGEIEGNGVKGICRNCRSCRGMVRTDWAMTKSKLRK